MIHQLDPAAKTLTVLIPTDVVSTNAEQLRKEIHAILEMPAIRDAEWQTLRLDLKAASMVDSVGLNLIVSLIRVAKSRNAKVAAVIGNSSVQRSFVFTRLNTQMDVQMAA